jgi:hypothetical protein
MLWEEKEKPKKHLMGRQAGRKRKTQKKVQWAAGWEEKENPKKSSMGSRLGGKEKPKKKFNAQQALPRKEKRKHWIKRKLKERSREEAVKEKAKRAAAGREGKLNQQNGLMGSRQKDQCWGGPHFWNLEPAGKGIINVGNSLDRSCRSDKEKDGIHSSKRNTERPREKVNGQQAGRQGKKNPH